MCEKKSNWREGTLVTDGSQVVGVIDADSGKSMRIYADEYQVSTLEEIDYFDVNNRAVEVENADVGIDPESKDAWFICSGDGTVDIDVNVMPDDNLGEYEWCWSIEIYTDTDINVVGLEVDGTKLGKEDVEGTISTPLSISANKNYQISFKGLYKGSIQLTTVSPITRIQIQSLKIQSCSIIDSQKYGSPQFELLDSEKNIWSACIKAPSDTTITLRLEFNEMNADELYKEKICVNITTSSGACRIWREQLLTSHVWHGVLSSKKLCDGEHQYLIHVNECAGIISADCKVTPHVDSIEIGTKGYGAIWIADNSKAVPKKGEYDNRFKLYISREQLPIFVANLYKLNAIYNTSQYLSLGSSVIAEGITALFASLDIVAIQMPKGVSKISKPNISAIIKKTLPNTIKKGETLQDLIGKIIKSPKVNKVVGAASIILCALGIIFDLCSDTLVQEIADTAGWNLEKGKYGYQNGVVFEASFSEDGIKSEQIKKWENEEPQGIEGYSGISIITGEVKPLQIVTPLKENNEEKPIELPPVGLALDVTGKEDIYLKASLGECSSSKITNKYTLTLKPENIVDQIIIDNKVYSYDIVRKDNLATLIFDYNKDECVIHLKLSADNGTKANKRILSCAIHHNHVLSRKSISQAREYYESLIQEVSTGKLLHPLTTMENEYSSYRKIKVRDRGNYGIPECRFSLTEDSSQVDLQCSGTRPLELSVIMKPDQYWILASDQKFTCQFKYKSVYKKSKSSMHLEIDGDIIRRLEMHKGKRIYYCCISEKWLDSFLTSEEKYYNTFIPYQAPDIQVKLSCSWNAMISPINDYNLYCFRIPLIGCQEIPGEDAVLYQRPLPDNLRSCDVAFSGLYYYAESINEFWVKCEKQVGVVDIYIVTSADFLTKITLHEGKKSYPFFSEPIDKINKIDTVDTDKFNDENLKVFRVCNYNQSKVVDSNWHEYLVEVHSTEKLIQTMVYSKQHLDYMNSEQCKSAVWIKDTSKKEPMYENYKYDVAIYYINSEMANQMITSLLNDELLDTESKTGNYIISIGATVLGFGGLLGAAVSAIIGSLQLAGVLSFDFKEREIKNLMDIGGYDGVTGKFAQGLCIRKIRSGYHGTRTSTMSEHYQYESWDGKDMYGEPGAIGYFAEITGFSKKTNDNSTGQTFTPVEQTFTPVDQVYTPADQTNSEQKL